MLQAKLTSATNDFDCWFLELIIAKLKIDYHYVTEEEHYIEHILDSLPADYDATVEATNRDIDARNAVELDSVKKQIRARHSRICKYRGVDPQAGDKSTEKFWLLSMERDSRAPAIFVVNGPQVKMILGK